ncbi:MAG: TetR/AcrR family transcriptional regulator [Pseudomonadota bacterium]
MNTTTRPDTRTRLLDEAEARMRTSGFHMVSFRDLADAIGIKSASVHYYFRTKEDLARALVRRYSDGFFETLRGHQASGKSPVDAFVQTYLDAYAENGRGCLCGLLGAETNGLPDAVSVDVARFLQENLDWVSSNLPAGWSSDHRREAAAQILASLQGAMMLAVSLDDPGILDAVATGIVAP